MAGKCEECGCICAKCTRNNDKHADMHLHAEIENLRRRLVERDTHIVKMETQFLNEADKFPNGELASMREEARVWQEKYLRLHEAHKRVQKVNQNLEDKLLRIVDKCETEKGAFAKDIATLSHRLADANYTIHRLTQDNEKYRNDVNLAIQLLQCKPSNFVGQKYDSLPSEVQAKVRTYVAQKRRSSDASPPEVKSITVPISTFPPTAMVYNITKPNVEKHSDDESDDSKNPVDIVSAAIMAKVLEDRERERIFAKHCNSCTCHRTILMIDSETQTMLDKYDNVRDICDASNGQTVNSRAIVDRPNHSSGPVNLRHVNETKKDKRDNVDGKIVSRQAATMQKHSQNQLAQYSIKQKSTRMNNERAGLFKSNVNRSKQTRLSKRIDVDARVSTDTPDNWTNFDNDSPSKRVDEEKNEIRTNEKEPSPIEIINDRIWKSGWNLKTQLNSNETLDNGKRPTDTEFDVINDRVWRNDPSIGNVDKTRMTLIQVSNAVNSSNSKDFGQTEVATSPSFSSDSLVISTSNKSSSSSDALHTIGDKALIKDRSKSNWKERSVGPRNCFMRVTPGSKNILLDNVGQYQTVLYTSGTNRPNTALVHVAKSTRSGRSMSTSSEENSPIVAATDSTQLQRVAEWVQSSVGVAKTDKTTTCNTREKEKTSKQKIQVALVAEKISSRGDTLVKIDMDDDEETKKSLLGVIDDATNSNETIVASNIHKSVVNPFSDDSRVVVVEPLTSPLPASQTSVTEDLITFETCQTEDAATMENSSLKEDQTDPNYDVKITKEMEEIYLKLAASLDPVSLRLSRESPISAELTIEKYRKDRRIHVHKFQDKPK